MWVYSETVATSAQATEYRAKTVSSSFTVEVLAAPGLSVTSSVDAVEQRSVTVNEWGRTERSVGRTDVLSTYSDSVGSSTASSWRSSSYETVAGFTQSTSASTSENQGAAATTAAGSTSGVRTRDTYLSGTQSTTQVLLWSTSTTSTATRSVVTTAAGPTTASTGETYSVTTTRAALATRTTTSYATAASASLTAPEKLVPVTMAEVTEALWEVTATVETAGYAENVGNTVSGRTGTLATASTELTQASLATWTRASWQVQFPTLTLQTTDLFGSFDTYVPFEGVLPATATASRVTILLRVVSTTRTAERYSSVVVTMTGASSLHSTSAATALVLTTGTLPVTYNLSPTATSTGSFHASWLTVATREVFSPTPDHATSASGDGTAVETTAAGSQMTTSSSQQTATGTATATLTSTYSTTTTTVAPNGETQSESFSTYSTSTFTANTSTFDETYFDLDTSTYVLWTRHSTYSSSLQDIRHETVIITRNAGNVSESSSWTNSTLETQFSSAAVTSSITVTDGLLMTSSSTTSTATVSSSEFFSSSTSSSASTAYVHTGDTADTTASSTYSVSNTFTTTQSATATGTAVDSGFVSRTTSSSGAQSISWTGYVLGQAAAAPNTQAWTALAMHPRAGYRLPTGLAVSDAVQSSLGLSGLGTLAWSWCATQDDSAGPIVPIPHTDQVHATTGATVVTGVWRTSDSLLHVTTGISETYSTTEQAGVVTATYTRARTTATSTATAAVTAGAGCTWYIPQSTAAASVASKVGGVQPDARYGLVVYQPPGVRHVTRQSPSGSTSSTTWETFLGFPTGSSFAEAYPTRTESAWSVVPVLTSWKLYESGLSLLTESSGATAKPLLTLSLNPNL